MIRWLLMKTLSEKTDLSELSENVRGIVTKWRGELGITPIVATANTPIVSTQENDGGGVSVSSPVVTEPLILIEATQEAPQVTPSYFETFTQANGKRCGHSHTTEAKADACADRLSRGGEVWQVRRKA